MTPDREWKRTALVNDVYKHVEVPIYQALIDVSQGEMPEGITVHKENPFNDSEVFLIELFQPHVQLAVKNAEILRQAEEAFQRLSETDFLKLRRRGLTRRQCEVLFWVNEGKSDLEISRILGISQRTVNHHVASIIARLGAENRFAAVSYARHLLRY